MNQPVEGQKVNYIGDEPGLAIGDRGVVVSSGPTGSHVKWVTGGLKDNITLVNNWDFVVEATAVTAMDNHLDGSLVTFSVREAYDIAGAVGLMQALAESGHLTGFSSAGIEALQAVSAKVRNDPSMREVIAQLEEDEGDELVEKLAKAVLKEALRG